MSIKYSYEIVSVDEAARCMEVVYSSSNRKTLRIGTRLPYEGESVEDVVKALAPVAYWEDQEKRLVIPQTGRKGEINTAEPPLPLPPNPSVYDGYIVDKQAIEAFFNLKNVSGEVEYVVTMYNVTTKEILAHLFLCGAHLAKAKDGVVVEWYESNVKIGQNTFAYVSKNLTNGQVIDKYTLDQRGLVKVSPDNMEPTITRFGDFETLPPAIKPLLRGFEHRDKVSAWSLKPYGLVVEFSY
jgi:hypothetical protein